MSHPITVLTTQYERSNNPKDLVNLEILVDVNQSLNASLDILNDLLSLDKLENGIMDMNGQETAGKYSSLIHSLPTHYPPIPLSH